MTEEQKQAEKSKPVSSTPVPGTPWYDVLCFIGCIVILP